MKLLLALAATAALGSVAPAGAVTITGLYNTGVDNAGFALGDNVVDSHWVLGFEGATYTGAINGQFPIGPWVANTATSRWISPAPDAGNYDFDHSSDGIYTYNQVFSLTGYQVRTAALSGIFASDNSVDSITLNGHTITGSGGSFTSYLPFSASSSAFKSGLNLLTFTVRNFANGSGSNPTGLRVEVTGTAAVVPEPASWAMMVLGLGLVGVATRRRVRPVVA